MDMVSKILGFAREKGEEANHAEKIGQTAQGAVYAIELLGKDGLPMPVGLPRLIIANRDNYMLIIGDAALDLLESLELDE